LSNIFSTVKKCLENRGGTFAFSAEIVNESLDDSNDKENDAGFVMQSCARFAHKRWYIQSLIEANGFETLSCTESTVLRKHDELDVFGSLYVLSLPSSRIQ
jgi:predicted TPR repeat methyltransferase